MRTHHSTHLGVSKARQEALCELFFGRLTAGKSLVFFYTKSGHPLGEAISRLVVGVGTVEWISGLLRYESTTASTYPLWDRKFRHSIRPDGHEGFLIPYHDYLEPTGNADEDVARRDRLKEITVVPELSQTASFSFAGELGTADVALSTLVKCLDVVRKFVNMALQRGRGNGGRSGSTKELLRHGKSAVHFPGRERRLKPFGMRLGMSLVLELFSRGSIKPADDPWLVLDGLLRGARH